MIEYRVALAYLATFIGIVSYVIYFKQIFSGKVKPHAFSWFIWAMITAIVFAAQLVKGGGPGAWVTGFTALACFAISVTAFFKGKREFARLDWLFFISGLVSLVLWWLTDEPLASVILATITDACSASITIRKSYLRPFEESATIFALSSLKFTLALFALESYSVTTWLYPAYLTIANAAIVLVLLIRRQQHAIHH